MSESESRPTVPYISIEGRAQDIVGVAALLRNADLDLSLTPDAEFHQEGVQTIPERLGRDRTQPFLHGKTSFPIVLMGQAGRTSTS